MSKVYLKNLKDMQSIWYQDNIHQQHDSSKISLLTQASNRIQYDQELHLLHPMQLWESMMTAILANTPNQAETLVHSLEHCWRSRDELISDVLQWTPTYGRAKAGQPAWTYIQQFCENTGCSPKDLPEVMNGREKWQERVRDIRAGGTTWWWWYKGKTCHPVKVRLEEHQKAVCQGEIEKSGMVDHIWKEKGHHLLLWDQAKIIDWEESVQMLGYHDLLSRPRIERNTIWEPLIKKVQ